MHNLGIGMNINEDDGLDATKRLGPMEYTFISTEKSTYTIQL
jgi:hypothetical protein